MDIQRINLHTSAFNEITHLYFIKNIINYSVVKFVKQ